MPQRIQDYRSGFNALDYSYTYDDNLQVTSLTDNVISSFSITNMAYDGLSRLTSTTGNAGIGSSTMRYDGLGNITYYKNKKHTLDYAYDTNNRLEFVLGTKPYDSFTYDARGNVTNNSHHAFTYNLANQMVASGSNSYTYDGFNRRVIAQEGTKTNYSFYSQSGQLLYTETAQGGVNYIYLGKKLIAKDGVVPHSSARQHYLPYGGSVEGEKSDVGFTGHKFDTALNLSYMQARYYDPVIGRFYSNDPVGFQEHLSTPNGIHGFNRYTYANNNPYKYVDPNGEASYLVSRPLDVTNKANHNFVVTNASSIGDPNATVHSWGNRGDGTMGRVDASTTGNSETTSATDRAAWENAGTAGSGTTYREINAPDAKVDGLAKGVVEGKDYDLVPALDIGGDSVNSNSAAGAVATAADGGSSSVNNGVAQPGAGQSDRVPIMKTFVPEEYK